MDSNQFKKTSKTAIEKRAKNVPQKDAPDSKGSSKKGVINFRAVLLLNGKTATGFKVPDAVVESLGAGKKPAVTVKIKNYTYRSSIASMRGVFLLPVSAEVRSKAGIAAGDELDVSIELDNQPREVTVPADFKSALDNNLKAKQFFEGLSYSNKLRHILSVEGAKTGETRQRRIEKSIAMFKEGRAM